MLYRMLGERGSAVGGGMEVGGAGVECSVECMVRVEQCSAVENVW